MKILLGVFCFFVSSFAFSQEVKTTEEIEDYNYDGFLDTLRTVHDYGSGYGGRDCSIVNGATGEVYAIGIWGSFGNIRHTMAVPPNLTLAKNEAFLNRINEELLYTIKDVADPSLQWIIDANLSHYSIEDSADFDLVLFPSSKWIPGAPKFPEYHCVVLNQSDFNGMYHADGEKPEWYDDQKTSGYLLYFGGNHGNYATRDFDRSRVDSNGFYFAQRNDKYTVVNTAHGIVVQKGDTYKWFFVTDASLTDGPQKLRWYSIGKILLHDHYVIFQHLVSPAYYSQFFIFDIETGVCARFQESGLDILIENNNLLIKVDFETKVFDSNVGQQHTFVSFDLEKLLDQLGSFSKIKQH